MVDRHVNEGWIAEEILPIRQGEIDALDDAMEIVRRIMREPVEPEMLD